MTPRLFSVNGRTYVHPGAPVVVICIDGSEPDYHRAAVGAGCMPWLARTLDEGASSWEAHCAMPALTNPNNLSIATGCPPSVHGISGNYFFDSSTGEEVLMNDKRFLRAPSIFSAANEAGLDIAVVTAKDKLSQLLGAGLVDDGPALDGSGDLVPPSRRGICFSAEKADRATVEANGIGDVLDLVNMPLPDVYSADLSIFALAAGLEVLRTRDADLMYISLSDYVQHKNAPGTAAANHLYAQIDHYASRFEQLGAIVVLTADHGMSAKTKAGRKPNVVYLEDKVREILGATETQPGADGVRVILPITDPYTAHHGALGSFAGVYLPEGTDPTAVIDGVCAIDGVQAAYTRECAAARFSMPADRIGDVVVLAEPGTALGRFPAWHDLSSLDAPLRSHGALGELQIPFIVNRSLPRPDRLDEPWGDPAYVHNYDAFWVGTTLVSEQDHRSTTARTG